MKTTAGIFSLLLMMPPRSTGQTCTGAVTSVSYDTVFYTTGGDGNAYNFTPVIPKFTLSGTSTLLAVTIRSYFTGSGTMQLKNTKTRAITLTPYIADEEDVQLNGSDFTSGLDTFYYPSHQLNAAGSAGSTTTLGPGSAFNNYPIIDDSITTADPVLNSFVGSGPLDLEYVSYISYAAPSGVNATLSTLDTIRLSITYYYSCLSAVLSTDMVGFTAAREGDGSIRLDWTTVNEQAGRRYEIEFSSDGTGFTPFAYQAAGTPGADDAYTQLYRGVPCASGKLYFRVRQVNAGGVVGYSAVREVEAGGMGKAGVFYLYPNPAGRMVNVVFRIPAGAWQVEVFSASGKLVQSKFCHGGQVTQLYFDGSLPSGVYFVRGIDPGTGRSYSSPLLISSAVH